MSRTNGAPLWRRVTLRDVLFVTLPPMLVVTWWFGAALADYHRIRQFDDWWSNATSVRKFAWYRLRTLLRAPQMLAVEHRLSPESEDKPVLRLLAHRSDWDRIDSDVAGRWGEWIDVQVADGNELHGARLRWRGDGSVHWTTEKKSFTLKMGKHRLFHGFRAMAFSVKDVFPQWLVGSLASDFGLIAPEQELVPVYLNQRFYGLHRFVEPVDESFLRRHVRLPGNIFRADTAERGDYFKGLPREVFKNPYIWDRVAKNDRPGAIGTKALGEFLADVNDATPEGTEHLMERLDTQELSRLLAFLLLVGDPYHMSGVHNQFWYEDPSNEKLHPIAWDVRLLDLEEPPHGANINAFWRAALRDPRIWDGAMREVAKWLEGDKLMKLAEERVARAAEKFKDELAYDNLRAGVIPPVGDPQTALATLRKNCETLRGWINDSRIACSKTSVGSLKDELVVDCVVSGRAPCSLSLVGNPREPDPRVYVDWNRNGFHDDGDALLGPVRNLGAAVCGITGIGSTLEPQPRIYRYFIARTDDGPALDELALVATNAATGQSVAVDKLTSHDAVAHQARRGWWNDYQRVQWSGEVHMTQNLVLEPGSALDVAPGTTLSLDPNVSLLIRGRIKWYGTEAQPITIQRADPNLPWGVVALQGNGCDGSRFDYVKFLGGGGGQLDEVEYTGMVCVHDCQGVVFDHCEFANNVRCDDSLHVDRGNTDITHCWFHDGNSDSIDFDMSTGLIAYNKIERTFNDGIDLMTCGPRIVDNDISFCGDKGISIGEASFPLVFNNRIHDCNRGIEPKDNSTPLLLHTSITNCKSGVMCAAKNWRYGAPGWPTLVRSTVTGNVLDYDPRDGARRTLDHTWIGEAGVGCSADAPDLEWLMRELGIAIDVDAPGPVEAWRFTDKAQVLARGAFAADFVDPSDGWIKDPGVARFDKRDGDLVASFDRERGHFGRVFDWDFSDASREYVLVLELAGEGVQNVEAKLLSPDGDVPIQVVLDADPKTYRFSVAHLPPRKYTALSLAAEPTTARSRLFLHGYRVVAWPRAGER